jgi:hypothetical protein
MRPEGEKASATYGEATCVLPPREWCAAMTFGPQHVRGQTLVAKIAWVYWAIMLLLFMLYAGWTVFQAIEQRASPPSTQDIGNTDYNTPRMLFCPSAATGGAFVPEFHKFDGSKSGLGTKPPPNPGMSSKPPAPAPTGSTGASPAAGSQNVSSPGSGKPAMGRRQLQPGFGKPPGAKSKPTAANLKNKDGTLSDAALSLLSMPYCAITLEDNSEFPCTLTEVKRLVEDKAGWPKMCLELNSEYIGACRRPQRDPGQDPDEVVPEQCAGSDSQTWQSVEVRFMFEVLYAPPIFAKEFQAFL